MSAADPDRVLALVAVAYAEGDVVAEALRINARPADMEGALELVRLDLSIVRSANVESLRSCARSLRIILGLDPDAV